MLQSKLKYLYTTIFILLLFTGCKQTNTESNDQLNIVTTTGMIADAVTNIVGKKAKITALMGPGVDPHLYKATQGDLKRLEEADIIIYNGQHLEGKMAEVLEKLSKRKKVYAITDGISKERLKKISTESELYDPHVWFDVSLWKEGVAYISTQIQKTDSINTDIYKKNTEQYLLRLDSLHQKTITDISSIPVQSRVLITAHDAFSYFSNAYQIEVKGLQGISTVSDFGLKDLIDLVDYITERKVKAVFTETSVSEKSIKAVIEGCKQKGHNIQLGGPLYSDAMGETGSFEGTYIGMVSSNVNKIVSALK